MSTNNSGFSVSNDSNSIASSVDSTSSSNNNAPPSSVAPYIMIPILSLAIILALFYGTLLFVRKTFRTNKHNWFIINACVTTAFLSGSILETSVERVMNILSPLSCRVLAFIPIMAASQMMYAHAVVSVSRFLTIVYANKRSFRSTACVCILIGIGWIVALLLAVPYLVTDGFACIFSIRSNYLPYYAVTTVIIIPILTVLALNIRIFLFVRRSTRRVQGENGRNNISQARDVRLVKIMVITFSIFVIGWCPLFLEQIFIGSFTVPSILDTFFQVLPTFSMLADIILLIYTNQSIRQFIGKFFIKQPQLNTNSTRVNTVNNT